MRLILTEFTFWAMTLTNTSTRMFLEKLLDKTSAKQNYSLSKRKVVQWAPFCLKAVTIEPWLFKVANDSSK